MTKTDCGFDTGCHPGDQIVVQLNNQLDATTFDPAAVTISPAVPAASIGVSGNAVVISAATAANTAYSIGLPADLADVHGQRLGDTEPVQVEVGDARPALQPFANLLTTLDPFAASADPAGRRRSAIARCACAPTPSTTATGPGSPSR